MENYIMLNFNKFKKESQHWFTITIYTTNTQWLQNIWSHTTKLSIIQFMVLGISPNKFYSSIIQNK